jgi:ribosomal protein S6
MDKRNFARVRNKKHSAGFYANVIFECDPAAVNQLKSRFALNEDVLRVLFTRSAASKTA